MPLSDFASGRNFPFARRPPIFVFEFEEGLFKFNLNNP
jgi:hypothetical protein